MKKLIPESLNEFLRAKDYAQAGSSENYRISDEIFDLIKNGGSAEEIDSIIENNPDTPVDINYMLLLATMKNRTDIVQYLMDTFGDDYIGMYEQNPERSHLGKSLKYAQKMGFNDIIEILSLRL